MSTIDAIRKAAAEFEAALNVDISGLEVSIERPQVIETQCIGGAIQRYTTTGFKVTVWRKAQVEAIYP